MKVEPDSFWNPRNVCEAHFICAGLLAFLTFLMGIVVMGLLALGGQMYVATTCQLDPMQQRCVVLHERGQL